MIRMLLATVALALPLQAHALSCMGQGVMDSLPARDANDVPTNAIVSIKILGEPADVQLRSMDPTNTIDVTLTRDVQGSEVMYVLDPTVDLAPGDHQVVVIWGQDDGWEETVDFTVVAQSDTVTPSEVEVLGTDHRVSRDVWGRWESFSIELSESSEAVRYDLEIADNEAFEGSFRRTAFRADFALYDDPCNSDPEAASNPKDTWIRVKAVDIAGNEADANVAQPFGGCSSLAAPIGGTGLLGLTLLLLGLRRRQR